MLRIAHRIGPKTACLSPGSDFDDDLAGAGFREAGLAPERMGSRIKKRRSVRAVIYVATARVSTGRLSLCRMARITVIINKGHRAAVARPHESGEGICPVVAGPSPSAMAPTS